MSKIILKQLNNAKKVSEDFGLLSHAKRILILKNLIKELQKNKKVILEANAKDLKKISQNNPMRDRLVLNNARLAGMIKEIENLIKMPDPIGEILTVAKD